jgi:Ca-activated chloride channel homolog
MIDGRRMLAFPKWVVRAAVGAVFVAGLWVSGAGAEAVDQKVEIDRPVVLAGDDSPIYVLVRFQVPEAEVDERDRPLLNLALVLDRSGSMKSRGKLEYAKRAAKMVVDSLKRRDRLAIVEYDDKVTLLWPSSPVEAPRMVKRLIDQLQPRGSTNLSGGMMRGAEEIQDTYKDSAINRVLLLSDGLANRGATDPAEIRRLVRKAKRGGVNISTMGLGLDYNEDLMQDIAENAGGNYYYIEHPDQMAGIFRRELLTLFHTVARKADLRFEAGGRVRDVEVFGVQSKTRHDETTVELEDFYAGESRSVLIRLKAESMGIGRNHLGTLRFAYEEVETGKKREFITELAVDVSRDQHEVDKAANKEVSVEITLVEAERRHRENVALFQKGRHEEARKRMQALNKDLESKNAGLDDMRISKKMEALQVEEEQMDRAAVAGAPAQAGYLKATKQRLYKAQKGQRALYMLREGDHGYEVEQLQKALSAAGVYAGPVDGRYGSETSEAVKTLQKKKNLSVDGIAGPSVKQLLNLF